MLSFCAHFRKCLQPFVGTLLWHGLRLEWQKRCFGYAVLLGYYERSMAVLVAVLRHAAMALAAAGIAAMFGLEQTRSAFVHAPEQCWLRCVGTLLCHQLQLEWQQPCLGWLLTRSAFVHA